MHESVVAAQGRDNLSRVLTQGLASRTDQPFLLPNGRSVTFGRPLEDAARITAWLMRGSAARPAGRSGCASAARHPCSTKPGAAVDPAEIRAATSRQLAAFKRPEAMIVVDELPRNATGKMQKALLRAERGHLFAPS